MVEMNLEKRKEFEKWAAMNGFNILLSKNKVRDNQNPYFYHATYWAFIGWCGGYEAEKLPF